MSRTFPSRSLVLWIIPLWIIRSTQRVHRSTAPSPIHINSLIDRNPLGSHLRNTERSTTLQSLLYLRAMSPSIQRACSSANVWSLCRDLWPSVAFAGWLSFYVISCSFSLFSFPPSFVSVVRTGILYTDSWLHPLSSTSLALRHLISAPQSDSDRADESPWARWWTRANPESSPLRQSLSFVFESRFPNRCPCWWPNGFTSGVTFKSFFHAFITCLRQWRYLKKYQTPKVFCYFL